MKLREEEGMNYLTHDPVQIMIAGGVIVWIKCDSKGPDGEGSFNFYVDMRALVKAIPVEKLPKAMTRKMIPDICRSKIQETYSNNYMSVRVDVLSNTNFYFGLL